MSFNSFTYYANKYARKAWEELSAARVHKQLGHAVERIENSVKLARIYMHLSLNNRRQRQMQKEHGW
jgi:hypothetical protein